MPKTEVIFLYIYCWLVLTFYVFFFRRIAVGCSHTSTINAKSPYILFWKIAQMDTNFYNRDFWGPKSHQSPGTEWILFHQCNGCISVGWRKLWDKKEKRYEFEDQIKKKMCYVLLVCRKWLLNNFLTWFLEAKNRKYSFILLFLLFRQLDIFRQNWFLLI